MLKLSAALAALLAFAPLAADAKCMRIEQLPTLPLKNVSVPLDGALVLAVEGLGPDDKAPMLKPADWKLSAGGKTLAPVMEQVAPGLVRYTLPPNVGTAKMMQGKTVVGSLTLTQQVPAKLAAPAVKAVVHDSRGGWKSYEKLEVKLASPLPAGVLAVVIADKTGKGRSFELVQAGQPIYGLERGRCEDHPEGTVISMPGDEVVVFYVDRHGRKSPASAPIKVSGTVMPMDPDDL